MYLSVCSVFVFAVGLEGLRVHGPSAPLVAHVGAPVLLPCFIESPLPLEDLQVEWRKMDSDSLVIVFQQGKHRPDLQSQEFRDRVNFFPDEVSKGNFSILLRNVVEDDAGGYRCKINTTQDSSEVIMEIKDIKNSVMTGANHTVFAYKGEDVILKCSVDSHVSVNEIEEVTWKKTDRDGDVLVLLYQDGEIIPESSHEIYKDRVDFFSSEISKGNFSLKLMDVRMEDKGEFVCEVHTSHMSIHTSVVLQGVGFSALHILILVLCGIALLLAVGFSAPVYKLLVQKETSMTDTTSMTIHISLILFPNIFMFVAFCLWSTEGSLSDVITCSVVCIMRPVMLMKTSPCLVKLSEFLQKPVKTLAVPLYYSSIVISACSFFFSAWTETKINHIRTVIIVLIVVLVITAAVLAFCDLRIHLTVILEIVNSILLAFIIVDIPSPVEYDYEIQVLLPVLNIGVLIVLSLQRHLFMGKTFRCVEIAMTCVTMISFFIYEITMYVVLSFAIKDFVAGWRYLFAVAMYMFTWPVIIYLLRYRRRRRLRCCSQWRKIGYLFCAVIDAVLIIVNGAMCFYYIYILVENKGRAGYLALMPLVHVLAATGLFKHPKYLSGFLHRLVFMFGAVGISSVNAIALATELILKAGKGEQTIGELRVIVLPFETVFFISWLVLQIYDAWMRFKNRSFEDERRTEPERIPEMEVLSDPTNVK